MDWNHFKQNKSSSIKFTLVYHLIIFEIHWFLLTKGKILGRSWKQEDVIIRCSHHRCLQMTCSLFTSIWSSLHYCRYNNKIYFQRFGKCLPLDDKFYLKYLKNCLALVCELAVWHRKIFSSLKMSPNDMLSNCTIVLCYKKIVSKRL